MRKTLTFETKLQSPQLCSLALWACISVNFEALDIAVHDQVSTEDMQSLQYKLKFAAT